MKEIRVLERTNGECFSGEGFDVDTATDGGK
jgi:hypothetical protein